MVLILTASFQSLQVDLTGNELEPKAEKLKFDGVKQKMITYVCRRRPSGIKP